LADDLAYLVAYQAVACSFRVAEGHLVLEVLPVVHQVEEVDHLVLEVRFVEVSFPSCSFQEVGVALRVEGHVYQEVHLVHSHLGDQVDQGEELKNQPDHLVLQV